MTDDDLLDAALRHAGHGTLAGLPRRPLPMRGVAHDHIAIEGSGLLLRIPRLSQWSLNAVDSLAYQAAGFARAAPSGHTPALAGVLQPGPGLPRGALLVAAIAGGLPRLPGDLAAIARALAAIHALPVPAVRAPLLDHNAAGHSAAGHSAAGHGAAGGPFRATLAGVEAHAAFLPRAGLHPESMALLAAELAALRKIRPDAPEPVRLVGTDTHPGNFLMATPGCAVFVDLEKALYGAPSIDLAHATLPTSTLWDPGIGVELSTADTTGFYRAWMAASAPDLVAASRPWFAPARRLTWLRTLFWAVRWRVLVAEDPDWSRDRMEPALAEHLTRVVSRLLDPRMLRHMRETALAIEL